MDSLFTLREKYDSEKNSPSFCLDCHQDSKEAGLERIINMTTGACQTGCSEKISNGSVIEGITREYCHVCGRGCQDCEIPETSNCLSCSTNFYFQEETKKCLKLTETLGFWMTILAICLFSFLLCILAIGVIINKVLTGQKILDQEEKIDQEVVSLVSEDKEQSQTKMRRNQAATKIQKAIKKYLQKRGSIKASSKISLENKIGNGKKIFKDASGKAKNGGVIENNSIIMIVEGSRDNHGLDPGSPSDLNPKRLEKMANGKFSIFLSFYLAFAFLDPYKFLRGKSSSKTSASVNCFEQSHRTKSTELVLINFLGAQSQHRESPNRGKLSISKLWVGRAIGWKG